MNRVPWRHKVGLGCILGDQWTVLGHADGGLGLFQDRPVGLGGGLSDKWHLG